MSDTGIPSVASRLAGDAVDGAAAIGKAESYFGLVVGVIFTLILVITGIVVFVKKQADPDQKTSNKVIGGTMVAIGLGAGLLTGFSFYMTQHFKSIAAINGAGNVFNIGRAIFHK